MSNRTLIRLTWLLLSLALGCIVLGLGFMVANTGTPVKEGWGPRGFQAALGLTNAVVGAAILVRYPRHLIGWLFSLVGLSNAVSYFAEEYAVAAVLRAPGSLPLGIELAWVRNWIWPLTGLIAVFLPLLFPDGRLPSARWRPVAWLAIGSAILMCLAWMPLPGPMANFPARDNPFGIPGAADVLWTLFTAAGLGLGAYRRGPGRARAPLPWCDGDRAPANQMAGLHSRAGHGGRASVGAVYAVVPPGRGRVAEPAGGGGHRHPALPPLRH